MKLTKDEPRYPNPCPNCIFTGSKTNTDNYICPNHAMENSEPLPSLVAVGESGQLTWHLDDWAWFWSESRILFNIANAKTAARQLAWEILLADPDDPLPLTAAPLADLVTEQFAMAGSPQPKWTKEKPTEPGWYWIKMPHGPRPYAVEVFDSAYGSGRLIRNGGAIINDMTDSEVEGYTWLKFDGPPKNEDDQ